MAGNRAVALTGIAVPGITTDRNRPSAHGVSVRRRPRLLRTTALLGCLLAPLAVTDGLAAAESEHRQDGQQLVQTAKRWNFTIPAQDLAGALMTFSETTGIQVLFKSQDLAGVRTAGLSGEAGAEDALLRLLGSSGLSYRFTSESSVVVSAGGGDSVGADGAITLDMITVEDYRNITSYQATKGYVSHYSVAATKTDTPVIETPQSISTVGRQELDDRDVQTVAEAVRYSPGVAVDTYGVDPRGFDSIQIRGFDAVTSGSFRDGLRMDGNFFAAYTTEPYGIERVDIMRGPSGALYGQAEAGGVIDRTTKRPRAGMTQEVQLNGGDWRRYGGAFDLGGAVTEDEQVLLRLTGLARSGDTEFDYNDGTEDEEERIFIAPALTWNPGADTSLTILADYMKDKRATNFGTFANDAVGRTDVIVGEPGFDTFEQEQFAIGYNFAHRFDDMWEFRQNARYFYVDVEYQTVASDYLEADNETLQRYVWGSPDTLNQVAIDNQLESRFELGPTFHVALMGFDYSRSSDEFSFHYGAIGSLNINNPVYTGATLPAPYQETEQILQQGGIYLQDQISIYDNLILTLGGRYSYVEQETRDLLADTSETKTDDAFTGRVGLTYLFDNGLAPYVSYNEGFVPTEGTDLSGESFEPQESVQYEVGLKYQPRDFNALFTASLFHLTKTNVLTRDPDNLFASVQSGEIRSQGIELEAKATLVDGLDLTASYTYVDAEVTESNDDDLGKVPVAVPAHTASAWLYYRFQEGVLKGLRLGGGLRYVGTSYHDSPNTSKNPDYLLADAAIGYDFLENFAVQVNANNLFDKEYTTTCAFSYCYYGTGRRVLASLSYRW